MRTGALGEPSDFAAVSDSGVSRICAGVAASALNATPAINPATKKNPTRFNTTSSATRSAQTGQGPRFLPIGRSIVLDLTRPGYFP
jgi:hypothetical protein